MRSTKTNELEKRIEAIEQRNKRVEKDKAWETSLVRKLGISILTYLTVFLFFWVNQNPNPWLNAILPALGFLLSTLTLQVVKDLWIKDN